VLGEPRPQLGEIYIHLGSVPGILGAMGMLAALATAAQLLAFGNAGLRVGDTTRVDGEIDAAAYDPAMDLVWFVAGGKLEVLDLRDPTAAPVVIAKGLPEGAFAIAGESSAVWSVDESDVPYPQLTIAKGKGKVTAAAARVTGATSKETKAAKKAIKKMKLVGKAWLAALPARASRTPDLPGEASLPTMSLPAEMQSCDVDGHCGTAFSLGDTRFELVAVADDCADGCTLRCVLYDPEREQFASPAQSRGDWGAPLLMPDQCTGYVVEPGGDRYAVGTALCTVGDEVACEIDPDWIYVAWIS
jgi:hypothetical protein